MIGHLAAPIPPGQDAPPHITAAVVLSNPEPFSAYYEVDWAPAAQAFEVLAVGFLSVFPPFVAANLALAVLAGLLCGGCALLARRVGGEAALGLGLAAAYSIGWIPAMGFYNFFAGIALGILGAAVLAGPSPSLRDRAIALPLFIVAAWAHIIAAAMAGAFVLGIRLVSHREGKAVRTAFVDVATLAPAALYSGVLFAQTLATAHDSGRVAQVAHGPSRFFAHTFDTTFGGFSTTGWLLAVAALAIGVAAEKNRRNAVVGVLLLAAFALVAAMPLHGLGWHFAKPRPAFFAFVAVPLLFRFGSGSRPLVAICALVLITTAISAVGNIREGSRVAEAVALYPQGDAGRVLEANFRPESSVSAGPGIRSGVGIPHYATLGGGALPGAFATNPQIHSLAFRGGRELFPATHMLTMVVHEDCRLDPECYRGDAYRADRLALTAIHWESIALVDPPPGVVERLTSRGYSVDGWLARANSADVRVHFPDDVHGPMVWQFGYPDTLGVFEDGSAVIAENGSVIRATDIPAGPTRIRVFIDRNQDGVFQAGDVALMDHDETLLAGEPTEVRIELRR